MKFNKQKGIGSMLIVAAIALFAVAIPVTTNLVKQNQENRSQAAVGRDCTVAKFDPQAGFSINTLDDSKCDKLEWCGPKAGEVSKFVCYADFAITKPCLRDEMCLSDNCDSVSGKCAELIVSANNSTDETAEPSDPIDPAKGCNGDDSKCPNGKYCVAYESTYVCLDKKNIGELCTRPGACFSGNCVNSRCVEATSATPVSCKGLNGGYDDGKCLSSQFCLGTQTGYFCTNDHENGEKCTRDAMCKSNACSIMMQKCVPPPAGTKCQEYNYGEWSACKNGRQTRTYDGYLPQGCVGTPSMPPIISKVCQNTSTPSTSSSQKVDGVCGDSNNQTIGYIPTENLCITGEFSQVSYIPKTSVYNWRCLGSKGGRTVNCKATIAVDSEIPAIDVEVAPIKVYLKPNDTVKVESAVYPKNSTDAIFWYGKDLSKIAVDKEGEIKGVKNGTTDILAYSSTEKKYVTLKVTVTNSKVDAKCASVYKSTISNIKAKDDGTYDISKVNLCISGTPSNFTNDGDENTWKCTGFNGGKTVSCKVRTTSTNNKINGGCGIGGLVSSKPTSNLCSKGVPTVVVQNGPIYTWTCNGLGGGMAMRCSAIQR